MEGFKSDVFWATFTGEFVEILCEDVSIGENRLPLTVQGFLLDMDDEYLFIGEGPIEINAAVKKRLIAFISIIDPEDKKEEFLEILEDMPVPEGEDEIN